MEERKYHFERLTPIDDMDLKVYEEAIDYVFDNPDVKNVAISGAYSAGKSSVLSSYKKKNKNLKFLHISLAHFRTPDLEKGTDVDESILEGKILNQLIHQIPSENIPQTNFRVKKTINSKSVIKRTIGSVLFFISIIHFTCFNTWGNYVNTLSDNWFKSILLLSTNPYALIADGLLIATIFSFFVYGLIQMQNNKNIFRKLNLQGNEIEIFEESEDSYFDKYLNEVLYLFENSDADVIVFEDMDRFNVNGIFERLHEVNTLVNIQLQKENKKLLRFFYLLRDDIFISKDRTKFFDYIIPIVPVVDSSNSYDQFISHFKKSGLFDKFDENFLQGLSLYIDDMRILKNIYNEFVIYYNRLNITELNCNKMLAIIAYKNLFPSDFANLQLNQGFIYTLFLEKNKFIESEINKLKTSIEEKQQKLFSSREEQLVSMRELNAVFADKYIKNYSWYNKNDSELYDLVTRYLSGNNKNEYISRKQILEIKLNNKSSELSQEISNLEQNLIEIKSKQLNQIITRDNIDEIFSITNVNEIGEVTNFNEIKSSEYFDLLKYLIRNGYIDETYADYMTYFYEHSLSRVDKTFLRSIADKKSKEYTYRLKNPQMVVSRLRLVDFDQEEILNFDLLTYLLQSLSSTEYIERFINQLKNTKNFNFIGAYFDITTELPSYLRNLNVIWPEMFFTVINENLLTDQQIRLYSICSMYYSDDVTLKLVDDDNCLRDYISNSPDYLAIENPKIDRLIHCFKLLDVCFIGFDYTTSNKELFRAVYEESLYEINAENIQLIQTEILGIKNTEDIIHKNYTILCSNPDSTISKYINQNINTYFEVILKMSNRIIYDDEHVAITILNNSELTNDNKDFYISALRTTIVSVKAITDCSLWSKLIEADIVQYSESNIIDYFGVMKFDKSLISYINRCNIDLDFSKIELDKDIKEQLFDYIIESNSIKNCKYEQILVSLKFYYDEFNITGIDSDKIDILINTNIIRMTSNNLEFLRENYPEQNLNFISKNIEQYVDIMEDNLFSKDELLEILTWNVSDDIKLKLLEFSNFEISVIRKDYSPAVCVYIMKNNFMVSDLMDLCLSFDNCSDSVQSAIFDCSIKYIDVIIDTPRAVSKNLITKLICSDRLDKDIKIDLLIAMMPYINEEFIKEILSLLRLSNYLKIFDANSRPKFEINDENDKLLNAFKENKIIANYDNSEREGYYKITKIKTK
ncbi:MAG: hypothetical protein UIM53_07070 [Acutalibacteraceae bacterium]|nr:hypothetical protein [Acutalibacteraceae bacterium]